MLRSTQDLLKDIFFFSACLLSSNEVNHNRENKRNRGERKPE